MDVNPWFVRQSSPQKRFRLYCFPYAGGSAASFASWQAALNPAIEVCAIQLPGRGKRFNEKPYTSLPKLVEALATIIKNYNQLPFAFFGHSLGGLVAFELTRYCQLHGLTLPERLIVSGCESPQHRSISKQLHTLPDDELIEALKDYNGTPPEILEHRELMAVVLPTIRADFTLVANYQYHPSTPLNIPITVLAGRLDEHVSAQCVEEWQKETTNMCRVNWFEGDHFFINFEHQAVLNCVNAELADLQYRSQNHFVKTN